MAREQDRVDEDDAVADHAVVTDGMRANALVVVEQHRRQEPHEGRVAPPGSILVASRIGPAELLGTTADIRRFLQTKAPEAMSYAFLVLGLFAFGFWLRRRREVTYLLFALSTVVWVVRTMHYYTQVPTALIVPFWWLSLNALSWLMLLVYAFAAEVLDEIAVAPVRDELNRLVHARLAGSV